MVIGFSRARAALISPSDSATSIGSISTRAVALHLRPAHIALPRPVLLIPHLSLTYPSLIPHLSLTYPSLIPHLSLTYPSLIPHLSLTYPSFFHI